jgi:hypothetical protein
MVIGLGLMHSRGPQLSLSILSSILKGQEGLAVTGRRRVCNAIHPYQTSDRTIDLKESKDLSKISLLAAAASRI